MVKSENDTLTVIGPVGVGPVGVLEKLDMLVRAKTREPGREKAKTRKNINRTLPVRFVFDFIFLY